jgi:DNA-binding beta-propeller fold protein YncE
MKRLLVVLAILAVPAASHASPPRLLAVVTVESQNRLLVVDVGSGRVLRSITMPADPENVEAYAGQAAVVSTRAGAVTILDGSTLRTQRVLSGFGSPHIAAFAPSGDYLYVTDDSRGQLAVILGKTVRKIFVGYGAHHMAFSPDQSELWIALGERARSIAVVDTRNPMRPRLDDRPYVRVFDAETKRPVAKLYAGTPPAHVRFDDATFGRYAYVTSGNDATLRLFDWRSRRLVRVLRTSPGSFNLSVHRGVVATTSLTNGTMTVVRGERRVSSRRIAPATRDVALVP